MIVVVGLSHRTAPISVREKFVLEPERLPAFLQQLVSQPGVGEALLISTCNRVELVAVGRNGNGGDLEAVARECANALGQVSPEVREHLYTQVGGAAVRHLFRVAASLNSLVLGEPQILGQVKEAYALARSAGTVGPVLNRTLPRAIRAAKRVRAETSIGAGQVSVPSVAVDLTRQIFGELRGLPVLLVGSGEIAELLARLLRAAGARILVIGRNRERVTELAAAVGGQALLWAGLQASLVEVDVVITSTSAASCVIDREMVLRARRSRRGKNQFFIDLAVPRDVDPRVDELPDMFLYNIDDLSGVVAQALSSRTQEAERAEQILAEEAEGYDRWAGGEQATPTIVALRTRLRTALDEELSRSLRGKLKHLGEEERAALCKMLDAALNRVLHGPSTRLRQAATERTPEGLTLEQFTLALRELFALDDPEEETEPLPSAEGSVPVPSHSSVEGGVSQ